ncbi:MAG: hypothetical protein Q4G42_02245 [Neisseria sp.]|nr:hypothetical protein [Neisseria sp.]
MKKGLIWCMATLLLMLAACSRENGGQEPPASEPVKDAPPIEKIIRSEQQAFSVRLPESYQLLAEEPGNDIVWSAHNENAMLRIQLFSDNAQSVQYLADNTPALLQGVNEEAQVEALSAPPSLPTQADVAAWRVHHAAGDVLALTFRCDDRRARALLFNRGDSEQIFLNAVASMRCGTAQE